MSYLIHYNKNHSPKNGQFVSGDGDSDGITNDHANRSKSSGSNKKPSTRNGKNSSLKGIPKDRIYTTRTGEKVVKPIGFRDGTYTISDHTRRNNAGIRLAYVSPNNLMRSGYWYNADTGKAASFGNQWHEEPPEVIGKEYGKYYFRRGVNETASAVGQIGAEFLRALL